MGICLKLFETLPCCNYDQYHSEPESRSGSAFRVVGKSHLSFRGDISSIHRTLLLHLVYVNLMADIALGRFWKQKKKSFDAPGLCVGRFIPLL